MSPKPLANKHNKARQWDYTMVLANNPIYNKANEFYVLLRFWRAFLSPKIEPMLVISSHVLTTTYMSLEPLTNKHNKAWQWDYTIVLANDQHTIEGETRLLLAKIVTYKVKTKVQQ